MPDHSCVLAERARRGCPTHALSLVVATTCVLLACPAFAQTNVPPVFAEPPPPESAPAEPGHLPGQDPPPSTLDPNAPAPPTLTKPVASAGDASAGNVAFGADLALATVGETNSTTTVLAPLLRASLSLHPALALDLAWGFLGTFDGQGSSGRLGNPLVTGTYRFSQAEWSFVGGIGVTAPLASYPLGPDGRLYAFAYNQTIALWGMWNAWLWTPNRMAIPVSARVDRRFGWDGSMRAELSLAPIFGVRGDASGSDVFAQFALEGGVPNDGAFELRARVQVVLLPSDSVDRSQTAVGLRGVLKTRAGAYFAGVLVNVDEPYGIFGGLGRWGLHLGKEID